MAEEIQKVLTVKGLLKDIRELRNDLINLDKTSEEYANTAKQLSDLLAKYNDVMTIHRRTVTAAEGSYDALVQQMAKLRKEWRATNDEAQRNALGAQIAEINDQLKTLDASTGNYQRNVGNYASAFNGLNLQVQQVARELPSLTMGANTFFLAISNNLPMLTDEIKKLRSEGVSATTVIKQIITSMLSWQTALVVVITLLSSFGKEIGDWVTSLFKGKDALDDVKDAIQSINKEITAATADITAWYYAIDNASKGSISYQTALNNLIETAKEYGISVDNETDKLAKLIEVRENLTKAIQANALARSLENEISKASEELSENLQKPFQTLEKFLNAKYGEEKGKELAIGLKIGLLSPLEEVRKETESQLNGLVSESLKSLNNNEAGLAGGILRSFTQLKAVTEDYRLTIEALSNAYSDIAEQYGITAKNAKAAADTTEKIDATEKVRTETLKLQQSIREENRQNELRTLKENYDEAVKAFDERLKTETVAEEQQQAYRLALAEKFRADMAEINAKWDEADMEQFRTMAEQQIAEAESVAERIMTAYNTRSGLINTDEQRSTNSLNLLESTSSAAVIDDDTLTEEQKQQRLTEISEEYEQLRFEAQQRYAQQRIDLMRETLAAIEAVEGEGSTNALSMQQQIADAEIELLVDANNRKKALYESDAAKQEAAEKQKQKNTKATARIMQQSLSGIANLLGTLGDVYEQEGETSKKAAKTSKALKIAEATINTINGGIAAYMAIQSSSGIFGTILGAIQMATVLATGYANIAKIKAVNVDNPSESGGSSSSIGASVNPPAVIQQVPVTTTVTGATEEALLNQMVTAQNATANNTASAQRVYVVYSDIAQAGRRVAVQTSESTF